MQHLGCLETNPALGFTPGVLYLSQYLNMPLVLYLLYSIHGSTLIKLIHIMIFDC